MIMDAIKMLFNQMNVLTEKINEFISNPIPTDKIKEIENKKIERMFS